MSTSDLPSSALVLETNNLRGGEADAATVAASLARLLDHLRELPEFDRLAELVITHDGLPEHLRVDCTRSARRDITFVELPPGCDYYRAKNLGFDATSADVVIFADSDCWPETNWLRALLEPFAGVDPAQVVAGRTTYRGDLLGIAATTIDFMYFDSPLGARCTRNFYANNVAFRRQVFAPLRFPIAEEIYRGPCQILGLRLLDEGIPVRFVPAARTIHRFPDRTRELLGLRLLRGQDTTEFAPYLADSILPERLRWLGRLGPVSGSAVLAGRMLFSLRSIGRQDMPVVRGARKVAAAAAIAGITAIDSIGAIARGLGIMTGGGSNSVLSYHRDADALGRAAA